MDVKATMITFRETLVFSDWFANLRDGQARAHSRPGYYACACAKAILAM